MSAKKLKRGCDNLKLTELGALSSKGDGSGLIQLKQFFLEKI
jgi:hypothetical protein